MKLIASSKHISSSNLIAPCGIDCGVCRAHLRKKNPCPGCRIPDEKKPITRLRCKIKVCDQLRQKNLRFCFECGEFPCDKLVHLEKRYTTKYHTSPIQNLEIIRDKGIRSLLKQEQVRWTCACGGVICMHKDCCIQCGMQCGKKK